MSINKRVLLVDDELNLLTSVRRQLKNKYDLEIAQSGREGLDKLTGGEEFALVISDYKMPGMDGAAFLSKAREMKPDTVRMMLTGQADMQAVVTIINEGNIFRFLAKPCPPELLEKNIDDGIEQYRLVRAEKELLTRTLSGSLQVMADLLALVKPRAFDRGVRVRAMVKKLLERLDVKNPWQIEIASILSQIGCVTVPDGIIEKVYRDTEATAAESAAYRQHAKISSDLIAKIPRLEKVAEILLYQEKYFDGSGFPEDDVKEEGIPMGARILKVLVDYDQLTQSDMAPEDAVREMVERKGLYDEAVLAALGETVKPQPGRRKYTIVKVGISELNEQMWLEGDVVSTAGVVIGANRQRVSRTLIAMLRNYAANNEISEPISVFQYVD